MPPSPERRVRRRISTLLLATLTAIATLVLAGLVVMGVRLFEIQTELASLRDGALPRLVKLAQLSQEASATTSIAPALSTEPTTSEFETLLSRIRDKETSQRTLIQELDQLFPDEEASDTLRRNGDLLIDNLQTLTDVVRDQIATRKQLDEHGGVLRGLLGDLAGPVDAVGDAGRRTGAVAQQAREAVFKIVNTLLDPNRARFSRNTSEAEKRMGALTRSVAAGALTGGSEGPAGAVQRLIEFWSSSKDEVLADKERELANAFRVKALVEENSLIANRLLGSASNQFWRASADLEAQVQLVNGTIRFILLASVVVVLAFAAGNFVVWQVLRRRVFQRLDRMRDALRVYAEKRDRPAADPLPDEIGEISGSLMHYMTVIDEREAELAEKSNVLEQLSRQLAKYLSPQVYDSIFSGRQEVKVASSRKKLTIFFSDIAGFTEAADRLESEELTHLVNQYLTEMSRIALDFGATIDKYVGDAILIFFGDPESKGVKQDALACVKMAIAMRKRMNELADTWRDLGIERTLQARMGITTDFCTVGNFGSEDRMDYTIVGGAVNMASRLEALAAPGEILITYETFAQVRDEIRCEERGAVEVRGIAYPVTTYEVIDTHASLAREERYYREQHAHMRLDLDLDSMSSEDRTQAARILRRGLDLLQGNRDTPPQKSVPETESSREAEENSELVPGADKPR